MNKAERRAHQAGGSTGHRAVELPALAVTLVGGNAERRRGLAATLAAGGLELVSSVDEASRLAEVAEVLDAAVLLCVGDLEADLKRIAEVRTACPRSRIVAVSAELENRSVREMFEAGIDGFVLEQDADAALSISIRAVHVGQLLVPAPWRRQFGRPTFSPRQKQVLAMVVMGCTNAAIAKTLGIAESTVKSHLFSIFKKLGVGSREDAAAAILDPENGLGGGILTIPGGRDS